MSAEDIKITGEPQMDPQACRFIVDRSLFQGGSAQFASYDDALGSPLAERLFGIDGVGSVQIAENAVLLTKSTDVMWPVIGKQIGTAIREHIASGAPAVSEEIMTRAADSGAIRAKVEAILENEINPGIASHGGFIELLDVEGSTVYIRMGGGCQGCGMASVTLKQGVERAIRDGVPEVGAILDTTDHAAGTNPFYAPSAK